MASARRLRMDIAYQKCRTIGHQWEDFIPEQGSKRPRIAWRVVSLRCLRCTMERHDKITVHGAVDGRNYDAPEGYSLPADEVPTREQLRLSLWGDQRAKAKDVIDINSARQKKRAAVKPRSTKRPAKRKTAAG